MEFRKFYGEQLDSHGRQPRATATGDSHGRQPRATATGDGAGRRGRATGPGDGAGRRGRATGSNSTAQKRGAGITGPFVTTRTTRSFVIFDRHRRTGNIVTSVIIDSSDTDRATVLFVPPDTDVIIGIFATIVTIVTIVAVLVFVILVTIVATEIIVNSGIGVNLAIFGTDSLLALFGKIEITGLGHHFDTIVKSLSFGITDTIRAMVKFGKASTETLEVRRKFHSKRHNREIRQNRYLRHNRFPLLKLFVSRNIVSIQCRFEKSNGIPKILRGATRQPRATATGDSHGRQPRATATGDSHGRRGRATGPGDGAGRRGRATGPGDGAGRRGRATGPGDGEQLDSHGRRGRATGDSHGRQPRATAAGPGDGRQPRATGDSHGRHNRHYRPIRTHHTGSIQPAVSTSSANLIVRHD